MNGNLKVKIEGLMDILSQYRGGFDFEVVIDNQRKREDGSRMYVKPHPTGRGFITVVVKPKGEPEVYKIDEFPKEYSNLDIHAVIVVPETRTLLAYTKEFNRASVELPESEWVKLALQLNFKSIVQVKGSAIAKIKDGKTKGLSSRELEFVQDTLIPIVIGFDVSKMQCEEEFGNFFMDRLQRANSFAMYLLTSSSNGNKVHIYKDDIVYYGGIKAHVNDKNEAYQIYAPKIDLIKNGHKTLVDLYVNSINKLKNLSESEVKDIFSRDSLIGGLDY